METGDQTLEDRRGLGNVALSDRSIFFSFSIWTVKSEFRADPSCLVLLVVYWCWGHFLALKCQLSITVMPKPPRVSWPPAGKRIASLSWVHFKTFSWTWRWGHWTLHGPHNHQSSAKWSSFGMWQNHCLDTKMDGWSFGFQKEGQYGSAKNLHSFIWPTGAALTGCKKTIVVKYRHEYTIHTHTNWQKKCWLSKLQLKKSLNRV